MTDSTFTEARADTERTEAVRRALAGPWRAVLAGASGDLVTSEDLAEGDFEPDEVIVSIVRGTAAPADAGDVMPGSYNSEDLLVEFEDFDGHTEEEAKLSVVVKLAQAEAMAAGLNAAIVAGGTPA